VAKYRKRILKKTPETTEWLKKISSSKGIITKIAIDNQKERKKLLKNCK